MNIEIVEFYPNKDFPKNRKLLGHLHVYLIDYDMDIRCVSVIKRNVKKNDYLVLLPSRMVIDEEGKSVRIPLISFANRDKHKMLLEEIKKKGIEYIANQEKEKFG
jgi:hypothetical protein